MFRNALFYGARCGGALNCRVLQYFGDVHALKIRLEYLVLQCFWIHQPGLRRGASKSRPIFSGGV
eukprot:2967040-Amphidinium_carterae.1